MKKKWNYREILNSLALVTQFGLTMVANIAIGFFVGFLVDNIFSTLLFKIIGLLLGVLSGFYSVYRLILKYTGDDK